jgi:hypothetical protein
MAEMLSRQDATNAVTSSQSDDPAKKEALADARAEMVEIRGRGKFFQLRTKWSWAILIWISMLITFNCGLAIAVGAAWLDFANYQWFITAVTVETFLQVVALGFVAVRFLFSSGQRPSAEA